MAVQAKGTLLAGRYRVVRRLGAGGAAVVFLCEDGRLGRRVAVKRMHAHSPEDAARRLRREARLGASLSHPSLVSVFDTITEDEDVLIVMEYVDGETLADALARGPLPLRRSLEILRALASALDYVHARGVVHRDVKPANILLRHDGAVKLVDLGVGLARDGTRITRTGQVLGTPAYMSPEQVDGASPAGAMDVYALGAIAYELLSGEKAHGGGSAIEVAHRVVSEPPPDLRTAWPDAPPAAAEAVRRAMARDPADRPASACELVEELSDALGGPPTAATRALGSTAAFTPVLTPGSSEPRRARAWLPLAGILLVLGVAAAVIALESGGGGSSSGGSTQASKGTSGAAGRHHGSSHRAAKQEAAAQPAPAQTGATTTPPPTSQDPSAMNDEGKALIDQGRAGDAIPLLQRALAAFPDSEHSSIAYGWTLFNLGDAYLRSGDPAQAIPYLRARLSYPGQTDLVRSELEQAIQQAGGGASEPGPGNGNGGAKHPGKGLAKGHGKGD